MAWNPSPDVADCRDIAKKWGMDQVIIIGIERPSGKFKAASFGKNKVLCNQAGRLMDRIGDMMVDGVIDVFR